MSLRPEAQEESPGLWVVTATDRTERGAFRLDVLVASNDCTLARREMELRTARPDGKRAITRVPALGFVERALEPSAQEVTARAVVRFETHETGGAGVRATLHVVAVVPADDAVDAFIGQRTDRSPRVAYIGAPCPLRLSWAN